jgi:hypothetical protein
MNETRVLSARNRAEFLGSTEEIEVAVERGEVTFPMVMKLLYRNLRPEPQEMHERLSDLYFRALPQFVANCGGISESFYANEFVAGVVITQKDELLSNIWWDEFKFDTIPARFLESDFNDLRLKAKLYLSEDHRKMCNARLFRLYKNLITSLHLEYLRWSGLRPPDGRPASSQEYLADIDQLRREFEAVHDTYSRSALERGRMVYVTAAALGTAAILVTAGIAVAISGFANAGIWPGVIAGGALGALLSVLERLTRGSLEIQFESGLAALALSGASRPVVGSLSGMALYMLVKGSIVLPLIKAGTENDQGFFFAAVAFLAGFSERLLKDVLGNPATSVGEGSQESSRSAETPGRSSKDAGRPPAK